MDKLKRALTVAADALSIATDWNFEWVELPQAKELGLEPDDSDMVMVIDLIDALRKLAAP